MGFAFKKFEIIIYHYRKIVTNIFLAIFANRSKSKYINTWNKNIIIQV